MAAPVYHQRPDHNVESATLLQSLASLTTAVSSDLPRIANRCVEEGLISTQQLEEAQLQTKTCCVRANELLRGVVDQVSLHPRKFEVFLGILEESHMITTVLSEVRKNYGDNLEVRKVTCLHSCMQGHRKRGPGQTCQVSSCMGSGADPETRGGRGGVTEYAVFYCPW